MSNYPLISCVCPTVGKTKHLEEAVQSFLMQTYPNKEMIIFNNYPKMDIVFEHPNIKIINYKGTINGIGNARNLGNEYASGEYICTWDDDDISLPNRLQNLMRFMEQAHSLRDMPSGYELQCVVGGALYSEANQILKSIDFFASNSLISKEYLRHEGYAISDGEDHLMYQRLKGLGLAYAIKTIDYIYRWATGTYHVSGHIGSVQNNRQRILNWADSIGLPSQYKLSPYWERDYQKDADLFMESLSV